MYYETILCVFGKIRRLKGEKSMKQKKGRDYKMTRQWTNEDRTMKKHLSENIKASITRGELNEDKLVLSVPKEGDVK